MLLEANKAAVESLDRYNLMQNVKCFVVCLISGERSFTLLWICFFSNMPPVFFLKNIILFLVLGSRGYLCLTSIYTTIKMKPHNRVKLPYFPNVLKCSVSSIGFNLYFYSKALNWILRCLKLLAHKKETEIATRPLEQASSQENSSVGRNREQIRETSHLKRGREKKVVRVIGRPMSEQHS